MLTKKVLTFPLSRDYTSNLIFSLNLLLVGTDDGNVFMYAYGVFPTGMIDLNQHGAGMVC